MTLRNAVAIGWSSALTVFFLLIGIFFQFVRRHESNPSTDDTYIFLSCYAVGITFFIWFVITISGPTPATPTNLVATTLGNGRVKLDFTGYGGTYNAVIVSYMSAINGSIIPSNTIIQTSQATSITVSNLGNVTYTMAVTATNYFGTSDKSNTVTFLPFLP